MNVRSKLCPRKVDSFSEKDSCAGKQKSQSLSLVNDRKSMKCMQYLNKHIIYFITKTRLYDFDPLKPHYYIVKPGFTGVYVIFHISAQNIHCGYSLEPPRRGGSNEYPQCMF